MDGLPSASSPYFYGATLEQNFPTGNLCWALPVSDRVTRGSDHSGLMCRPIGFDGLAAVLPFKEAKPDRQVVAAAFPVCDEVIE
jgi:hypothetical protein